MTVATDKPKRQTKDKALLGVGILMSVVAILGAAGAAFAYRQAQKLVREELGLIGAPTNEAANWLLVGTDSRDGIDESDPNAGFILGNGSPIEGRRTDTMMIARVDPELNRIDLISIPRDLWVDLDGSQGRINAAYQVGGNVQTEADLTEGRRRLVRAIQANLGIEVNHYAEVDFVGFQNIVDSLGGVEFNFDRAARDLKSGFSVDAGPQLLDGTQALAYARARTYQELNDNGVWQTDPTADIGRTERQRTFLVKVAETLASSASSVNLLNTDRQISAVADNVVFSSSVTYGSLAQLASTYRGVGADSITTHSLPVFNDQVGTASVLRLQASEAESVLQIFRGQAALAGATVDVLNGSGVPGQAGLASDQLRRTNIRVGQVGDAATSVVSTEIRYNPGYQRVAEAFANMVGFQTVLVEDPEVEELTLVTGTDFAAS